MITGIPRTIRSDEWLSNTQIEIAQKNAGYPKVNHNIGNGEDTSLILDVPYKDWSILFKPHNLVFFVLPFDHAFAFKWWLLGYLLIISIYFFCLYLIPKRRIFASIVALTVFFSPFVQWWYQYITLASIYYTIFLLLTFMHFLKSRNKKNSMLLALLMTYLLVCFALIQYPAFQIPCIVVALFFVVGYIFENRVLINGRYLYKLALLVGAGIISGLLILTFLNTRGDAFAAIKHSAYPGRRNVASGRYDSTHFFSSQYSLPLQLTRKAATYFYPPGGVANQSESANFIQIMPFLVVPSALVLANGYKKRRKFDWPLLSTLLLFIILMFRLFNTHFSNFFKLLFLNQVPQNRLLIGFGLLGIINFILLVRNLDKRIALPFAFIIPYCILCFLLEIRTGLRLQKISPGFISVQLLLLLSIPIPLMIFALLRKRFILASLILLIFGVASSGAVNPLYKGTDILTNTTLSKDVQKISKTSNKRWVTEGIMLENYAVLNGAHSLSGVYSYPQLNIWKQLDYQNNQQDIYNRYAHINFMLDQNTDSSAGSSLELRGGDNIVVHTQACSNFLKMENVGFVLTDTKLKVRSACTSLINTIHYPQNSFYIYSINK
ncbi:MAG TPA: hypothetical protein VLF79_01515 [Candidatus Saccharimonadales bacterium]|nr:hypothetical protein [Candidatus Saccharimonadales bacterium]